MKVKCAIFQSEKKSIPTYDDIDKAQPKGAKVIYGGGKRKTKNIPLIDKLHLINHSFNKFESYIVNSRTEAYFYTKEIFLFQDKANEMLLKLRYSNEIIAIFEIDEKIIEDMHHYQWSMDWIDRQVDSLKGDIGNLNFFIEKSVGDKELHKKFSSHIKSTEKMIDEFEKSGQRIVKKAKALFTSGW